MTMDRYVVYCYCHPEGPSFVCGIDDDRANGRRVRLRVAPGVMGDSVRGHTTARGARRGPFARTCPRCTRRVRRLVDSTAASIIDHITRPLADVGSIRDRWGRTVIPYEECADPAARSDEFLSELQGDRDQGSPSDVPTVTRYSQVYVIPFDSHPDHPNIPGLCEIISAGIDSAGF